ncbi:dependent RNA helicase [Seminavis robusta]|uniref:RNA helicase n=1 Tax=Seminavis robusta TaxID=568900 RepID=A0A9N8HDW4_9STRA|nr:dependent RNA helicase [Seminavis robusta]|eukprot:Sro482_g151880.1 dependent RNA helicase (721) ;mRNA; r:49182-51344
MGWFDGDDDSSSDDEKRRRSAGPLSLMMDPTPSRRETVVGGDVEEDEDPLDAYMNTLNKTTTVKPMSSSMEGSSISSGTGQSALFGRMDLGNEDEATSHWETTSNTAAANNSSSTKNKRDDNDLDRDGFVKSSAVAKRAMQQTFQKAGAYKGGNGTLPSTAKMEGDEDDETMIDRSQSKHVDIQLAKVNHQQMEYEDFEKVFWKPTSTTTATSETNNHQSWRGEHGIVIQPPHYQNNPAVSPVYDFLELKDVLDDALLQHICKTGYHHPTPVQSQTLPVALSGHDALITAPTGSGKTLAYIWPMVVHVCAQRHFEPHETGPIGLVLVPTRELALQVHKHAQAMIAPLGGTSVTIIGGMGKYPLVQQLRQKGGVEIVIATPGRLLDVLASQQQQQASSLNPKKVSGVSLQRTTMVVLDECDRLLHMGFQSQVSQILENIRPNRQTLLLSATISRRIETVAQQWLNGGSKAGIGIQQQDYVRIAVGRTGQASLNVQQHVMVLPSVHAKLSWLTQMLPVLAGVGRTLVFCASKVGCEELAAKLLGQAGIQCVTLHGDKHQSDRNAALRKFVKQQSEQPIVMIATDVASRGLDIPDVTTVINYDPPKNLDVHVHRVGRAGRLSKKDDAVKEGAAYTLLRTPQDADIGHVLLGAMDREERPVPDELRQLASQSRQRRGGNGSSDSKSQSRNRWNKSGLGATHQRDSFYGSSSSSLPPPPKKGRWS